LRPRQWRKKDLVDQHVRRFDTNAKDTGNQADHRV
jgi:hypothetical protein